MKPTRILLSMHNSFFSEGIKNILAEQSGYEITNELFSSEALNNHVVNEETDILILDLDMPELDAGKFVHYWNSSYNQIPILAISYSIEYQLIRDVLDQGIAGYLLKKRGISELLKAIDFIIKGKKYLCNDILRTLVKDNLDTPHHITGTNITDREREVLFLICSEHTNTEIADKLNISVRTVDAHRRNLLQKTKARNTAGLVSYAVKHGFYHP